MAISIRKAKKFDIPLILDLLYELGRPKPTNDSDLDLFRKLAKKQISDSNKTILVAEKDGVSIVGMVSIVVLPRLNKKGLEIYLPELIVTKKYQNHGIGTLLIDACTSFAKERKCHNIRLESGLFRKDAHKFYKNMGFESKSFSFSKNLD